MDQFLEESKLPKVKQYKTDNMKSLTITLKSEPMFFKPFLK